MKVLGIESTCDEAACAIVRDGCEILSNVVASQVDLHRMYGGVVPELACRRHVDVLIPVIKEAVTKAGLELQEIDLVAVSRGPGLVGALLIGMNAAKTLALALNKPLVGVNHVEAHLYAALMSAREPVAFPCLGVVLSGGHTVIVLMRDLGDYQVIGQTADDAIGEAFDKVARMLSLPYPGGPEIEQLARTGDAKRYPFKGGYVKERPLDFSFSGLKTAVLYTTQKGEVNREDLAASFQEAAINDVISKSLKAAQLHRCTTLVFGGGVTANQRLRLLFAKAAPHYQLLWPTMELSLDNAAMIAGLGYHRYAKFGGDSLSIEVLTQMSLTWDKLSR